MSVDERFCPVDDVRITAIALAPRHREGHACYRYQLHPRHAARCGNPRATRNGRHFSEIRLRLSKRLAQLGKLSGAAAPSGIAPRNGIDRS
jgi:hypothetical protein